MTILSSVITQDLPQDDGRRIVRETHTDDQGNVYVFDYMAEISTDINAKLTARASDLNAGMMNG
jgi:hypothetical protein